jgi:hypothetical protein
MKISMVVVISGNILTQLKFNRIHLLRLWYFGNTCIGVVTTLVIDIVMIMK